MAIALVQHTSKDAGTVTSTTLAYASNPSANNLLLVLVRSGGTAGQPYTVSDTISNTWHGLTAQNPTGGQGGTQLFWAINSSTSADTVTVSISGAAATLRIVILEYSGTATSSPLDVENNSSTATSAASAATSVTPANNGSLVFSFTSTNNGQTYVAVSNFTLEDTQPANGNAKIGDEDWIQTTATATAGGMTFSSDAWSCGIAVFKPAGASTPIFEDDSFNQGLSTTTLVQAFEPTISVW